MNLQLGVDLINEPVVVKMMNDYYYEGYALFVLILCELCKQEDYKYSLSDLDILYVNIKANTFLSDRNFLNSFISDCINKYESKGKYLFQSDGKMFWSDDLLNAIKKKEAKKKNGEKGGRPAKPEVQDRMIIPDIDYVNLEKADYQKLVIKFGKQVIDKAIQLLDNWLAKKGKTAREYIGKNHYGFFRKDNWTITEAQKIMKSSVKDKWGNC